MARLTHDDLARATLARQFPVVAGRDAAAVLGVLDHLGPIQSQVPRSPFLTAVSRLPGVAYATVQRLFEEHQLVKTSSLRGTVHTTGRQLYGWTDAIARPGRVGALASQLQLDRASTEQLLADVEDFADDGWRARTEIVEHARSWVRAHASAAQAALITDSYVPNLVWGHSGLLRRPRDDRWEKRTDLYHRRARALLPDVGHTSPQEAVTDLVRVHLGAAGPLTRQDLASFLGVGLGLVDAGVARLGDQVEHHEGPDGEPYLDLVGAPTDGPDPGLRLLPEFDALLVGYHGRHRDRFLRPDQLSAVWAKANGQFAPSVLHGGRLVATWRTVARGARTDVEVTMLAPHPPLADDLVGPALDALAAGLDLTVTDLRVRAGPT